VFPVGANNVRVTYRYGAEIDGNVGSDAVTVNRSGMAYLKGISNPRPAYGWSAAEDADQDGIDNLKIAGPASLRALSRAVTAGDVEYLSVYEYADSSTGASPWSRAHAIEEGFGPKTVKNVMVPTGGGTSAASVRAALDEWFNGDVVTGDRGILVANQQVTSVDYSEKVIAITATIEGGDQATIEAFLGAAIQPEARLPAEEDDEIANWRWEFGEDIAISRLNALIHEADPDVRSVAISTPAGTTVLATDELPKVGVLTLTVLP